MYTHETDPKHAALSRELAEAQQREIMQLRAQLIASDTAQAHLHEDLCALEAAIPGLKSRAVLARESQRQIERIQTLERALLQARQDAERRGQRVDELSAELRRREALEAGHGLAKTPAATEPGACEPATARLDDRAVLCIGGRPAAVPLYRHLVEKLGARFLHHDGGEEDSSARLDATLAAADLVICQTGCISHNAYWRVKDHCKRTGKRCVYVETPSSSGIKRALDELQPTPSTS